MRNLLEYPITEEEVADVLYEAGALLADKYAGHIGGVQTYIMDIITDALIKDPSVVMKRLEVDHF